ncbi:50S ribosomal protein L25 [Beijerinckiaceae bacterium RH AL1]|nr:50S ribosomal protein L25/general stress protein Ctc [Beijerinckiaceae bacterium]VVB49435.1 50S ribosomal protein L25 [Beijerinckiaceae bacterium RH CH11]VVB49516.1 50S ribosomal protein L25 [Beijerinckiaceae bacterium RH AL8]VVC56901.1 50S ribosomal protein L25 [Beijerinckiaceae bacterium RH AL1]
MAETKSLAASVRSGTGKGAARSVRREGRIPGVVYGGGEPPVPISLLWHDVNVLIYHGGFLTTTFDLDIDGTKELVIPRDYQLDPVKDRPLHVDFLRIKKGSKIDVEIPVRVFNEEEAVGLKKGGVVNLVQHAIELKVAADAIPDAIEVDIAGMDIGDVRHLSDLKLPRGAKLSSPSEDDITILTIAPPVEEVVDEEPEVAADAVPSEEGDAEADAAEGDKSDSKDEKKDD